MIATVRNQQTQWRLLAATATAATANAALLPLLHREDWLRQLVAELDDTEPLEHVKALVDVHRLHLFDVVMQFRAVFADHGGAQLAGSGSSAVGGCSGCRQGRPALAAWRPYQGRLLLSSAQ
jgi:Dor1-like family